MIQTQKLVDDSSTDSDGEPFEYALQRYPHLATFVATSEVTPGKERVVVGEAMKLEVETHSSEMFQIWQALFIRFPTDERTVRLFMRWCRRKRQLNEGLTILRQYVVNRLEDPRQELLYLRGLNELHAYDEIDHLMCSVPERFPNDKLLRIEYIGVLANQQRYPEAVDIVRELPGLDKLGPASRKLIEKVTEMSAHARRVNPSRSAEIMARLTEPFKNRKVPNLDPHHIGKVIFYTGQLGAGGAERQMTRVCAALSIEPGLSHGKKGLCLGVAPEACVRHANPQTQSNFFLPVLERNNVTTTILSDVRIHEPAEIADVGLTFAEDLQLLPQDVRDSTQQLIPYFRERKVSVAYLWQDGGVLTGALAALYAGVPRIIASFRGLPPSLRPQLFRVQMSSFYRALQKVPGVTLSANSASSARAYERWLELPSGTVSVIYNAVPEILPDGDESDVARWAAVESASQSCSKTVLGIFRFDTNKRPSFWIETALHYCKDHPDTRFIIVGCGNEFNRCRSIINEAGAQDRVFLVGMTNNVGFWLHRATVLMHLAQMEGLPNVLIEAQLAGVPVVCTPAGGSAEIVKTEKTGIVLSNADNPNVEEIHAALGRLLETPDLRAAMATTAARFSLGRFRIDIVLEKSLDLFANGSRLRPETDIALVP